jgi:DNA-binding transcriptional ArsR family regulator
MHKRGTGTSGTELDGLVEIFRLLSDKTRLNILLLLVAGERNVSSLCDELALPQPTVSHHLGLLRMRNLINNRRDGKQVFYGLNGHVVPDAASNLQIAAPGHHIAITQRA